MNLHSTISLLHFTGFHHNAAPTSRTVMRFLAVAALVVFTWLALRHVHDSVFLEDQTDQLQNFEALARLPAAFLANGSLEPNALLGPAMSDTRPTAHALGPIGSIVFGVPVALGLGIDGIHVVTSLLIAGATALAFVVLLRIDPVFAWLWFWVFSATGLVWWNAGLLWVNTLLVPAGLLLMAVAAACLRRPTVVKIAFTILIAVFALQVHLTAVVSAPVLAIVIAVTAWQSLRPGSRRLVLQRPSRRATLALALLTIAAFGPYLLAESVTGSQNSRAMIAHVRQSAHSRPAAIDTARQTLLIAADPTGVLRTGFSDTLVLAIGGTLAAFALIALWRRLEHESSSLEAERTPTAVLFWLMVGAIAAIAGQAAFFALMRRPLAGNHYVTLLTPFYAVVSAAALREMFAWALQRRKALVSLAFACVAFLIWRGPALADRAMAPAMWSYKNIATAIDALCDGGAADVAEGDGFAAVIDARHDGVLTYLMKRNFVDCRYQPGGAVLLAAKRDGHYADFYVADGRRYRRDTVRFPGIALYRLAVDTTGPVHTN